MKEHRLSGPALKKHDVSLNSGDIADDFAASGSRRIELLLGWPIVPLPQTSREKVAILTLYSHDLTLIKQRQFYELF